MSTYDLKGPHFGAVEEESTTEDGNLLTVEETIRGDIDDREAVLPVGNAVDVFRSQGAETPILEGSVGSSPISPAEGREVVGVPVEDGAAGLH